MQVAIIGVGLIGGSLAIGLKESGFASRVVGVDNSSENLDKAVRRRLIEVGLTLEEAVESSDLIIVSTPVDTLITLLPAILNRVGQQVVIEVGSTKERVLDAVRQHPNRGRFVSTHPMAGTEYSGPEAAIPHLFDEKYTVLCETEHSDTDAVALVERMYEALRMKLVYFNGKEHDVHTAYVSHISHISSFALALTVLAKERNEARIFELASTGFSSTVRLAKSSPDTWIPIFRQNRDNVLDVLDEHINQLSLFRTLLIKKDFETFYQRIAEANSIKKIIQ